MAGQTPRFGLNFFGGDTPGTLDDDNDKFTSEDRLSIDRLLAALEKHDHRRPTSIDAPDDPPGAVLGFDGTLEAGTTYHYCVSFVNADGLETVSGPEVSIEMPELLPAPDAPAGETSESTGTLPPGLYYYALTGLRDDEESPLSDLETVTVLSDEDTVILTLPDLDDADGYQIWRQGENDPGWTRIAVSTGPTFTDDGSVPAGVYGDPANIPPTITTGQGSYSVTISLTGDDLTRVATANAWRIYRTEISGAYGATSLVHEVIERTDELDPESDLVTTWIDDGDAQLTGSPKLLASELQIPAFTFESADTLPSAAGYPDNYPLIDGSGVLYIARAGIWGTVTGQRGVAVFTGTGDPTGSEPTGAANGDVFIDTSTGDIYIIDGL